ncbi:dienelactone hydrolase family protein [Maricaulis sp. D1M11]|uniref:dienelactone hydrolase family protein n=1 Tax=Maricaulis sp. D1M11 TaxID=3076117 RepID=UPI0039B3EF98
MRLMTFIRRALPLIAAPILGVGGCAVLNGAGITVPQRSLEAQVQLIKNHVVTRLPENRAGPVPVVILFHGCGGRRPLQEFYADALTDAGYGVLIVDSAGARDIGRTEALASVCTAVRLWGQERAADVYAAVELARRHPDLDGETIALVGWSHGGWTALEALAYAGERVRPPTFQDTIYTTPTLGGLGLVIGMYPYCSPPLRSEPAHWHRDVRVRMVLAGDDRIANPAHCRAKVDEARRLGLDAAYVEWPGLSHAFDDDKPGNWFMQYDADAAHRARDHLVALLDEWQGGPDDDASEPGIALTP